MGFSQQRKAWGRKGFKDDGSYCQRTFKPARYTLSRFIRGQEERGRVMWFFDLDKHFEVWGLGITFDLFRPKKKQSLIRNIQMMSFIIGPFSLAIFQINSPIEHHNEFGERI